MKGKSQAGTMRWVLLLFLFLLIAGAVFSTAAFAQATPPPTAATVTPPSPIPPPFDEFYSWLAQNFSTFGPLGVIASLIFAIVIVLVIAYSKGWLKSLQKQGEKHGDKFITAADLPEVARRYVKFFIEDEKLLGFRGIAVEGRVFKQLEVNQVYVSICMVPESDPSKVSVKPDSASSGGREDLLAAAEKTEPIELAQAIQKYPRLAIIGAAGCGKSTLLQWAGLACASPRISTSPISVEQRNFLQAVDNRALIPMIIRLRAFHSYCKEKKINFSATALLEFLTAHLNEKHPKLDLPENFFETQLDKTGCLVMLDGVDEVDPNDREAVRQAIEDFVKDFSKNARNRFLVTSRSSAYFGDTEVGGFHKCWAQNLSPEQRNQLIKNWYEALTPDRAGELTPQLCQLIEESDARVKRLAVTPLMVTIFAQFYYIDGKLPRSRAELYEHAVTTILSGRHRVAGSRLGWETERNYLAYIAFQMHDQNLDDANEGDLIDLIWPGFGTSNDEKKAREAARQFLDHTTDQGGLLEEQYRRYGFYTHRTFREYLAGRYLAEEMRPDEQLAFLSDHLEKDGWEEPIHLAIGYLASIGGRRSNDFIRMLVDLGGTDDQHGVALALAAEVLYDIPPSQDARRVETTQMVVINLDGVFKANPPLTSVRVRRRLGLALGAIGDPRFPVVERRRGEENVRVILPDMLPVIAGSFQMGTSADQAAAIEAQGAKFWDDEKPDHSVKLSAFEIGRYPVTNAEFRLFWEDRGYARQEFWSGDGWRWRSGEWQPDLSVYQDEGLRENVLKWLERRPPGLRDKPFFWENPDWNANNIPVVGVCWFEAEAYCKWLSALTNRKYSLPSEAQWEKASRGEHSLLWPWGNEWRSERCNSGEDGSNKTTPVGMYPHGASPYGALDMAGNVWEWCGDYFDAQEYAHRQGTEVIDPTGPAARGSAFGTSPAAPAGTGTTLLTSTSMWVSGLCSLPYNLLDFWILTPGF